jgi:hypothetical protein
MAPFRVGVVLAGNNPDPKGGILVVLSHLREGIGEDTNTGGKQPRP